MPDVNNPRPDKPGQPRPGGPNMKMSRGIFSWIFFFGLALLLLVVLQRQWQAADTISISEFNTYVQNKEIDEIVLRGNKITGKRKLTQPMAQGVKPNFQVNYPPNAIDDRFLKDLVNRLPNAKISQEPESAFMELMFSLLPWVLILAVMYFFIFRQIRNVGAGGGMLGNFGRSRHRVSSKEHTNVTFADVAGVQEAQEEVQEIIEFLRNPKRFQRLGGRIPRGVLLVGEPGCGKTLLAKAIAGEADVPFFSISGSDFVEMFVGVGASRVRDLFKQAKDNAPCIIFLDEIDAVGRRRGANFGGGGHDEREQTLNAILVEMDGFDTSDQVIVIAATNRVDVLDPALIRPGRFDRQVFVPLPDVQGRYEILKVHARKIKLGPNVDLRRLARGTPMFSGADLAAIINEAALVATMAEKEYVEQDDLEESRDKVRWGRAKKSRVIDQKEKEVTAYHEAGHALVQALQKDADPLHKVSIIPRGPMGGATFSLPEKDRTIYTRSYLTAMLKVTFGGRLAEEIFCNDISSGAAMDIKQATEIAKRMVKEWGMNEQVGFVYYGDDDHRPSFFDIGQGREYSESTAELIDREIKRILDEAYHATKQLMLENREKTEAIARALMKYETITGEEVHALIRGESLERPSVGDLLDAEQRERKVGLARPVTAEPKASPNIGGGPLPQPG